MRVYRVGCACELPGEGALRALLPDGPSSWQFMVPTYLSTCLSLYLSLSAPLPLSLCLSVCLHACIYLSIYPFLQNLSECYCKIGSKAKLQPRCRMSSAMSARSWRRTFRVGDSAVEGCTKTVVCEVWFGFCGFGDVGFWGCGSGLGTFRCYLGLGSGKFCFQRLGFRGLSCGVSGFVLIRGLSCEQYGQKTGHLNQGFA